MADSALQAKGNAVYVDTTTNLSAAIGKLVTFTAGVPAVNASLTVPAMGVVLDARVRTVSTGATYYDNAILCTAVPPGPVRVLLNANSVALSFGDSLMQASDGTVTKDVGPGTARCVVGFCTDENGAQPGDFFEACLTAGDVRS
jgi:hypothetical protein